MGRTSLGIALDVKDGLLELGVHNIDGFECTSEYGGYDVVRNGKVAVAVIGGVAESQEDVLPSKPARQLANVGFSAGFATTWRERRKPVAKIAKPAGSQLSAAESCGI
jgi:hypothetical protein